MAAHRRRTVGVWEQYYVQHLFCTRDSPVEFREGHRMKISPKYLTLLGTAVNNITMTVILYIGNLSTYIYSLHYATGTDIASDLDPSWMVPMYIMFRSSGSFVVDFMKRFIGLRLTHVIGVWLFAGSICLTYFTVSHSIWATTFSFMVTAAIGSGIINTNNMLFIASWFDTKVGLASAVSGCLSTVGGIVMNLVITSYVNPENLDPNFSHGRMRLFSQPEILQRVPAVFLLIGALTGGILAIGFALLREPESVASLDNNAPSSKKRLYSEDRLRENNGRFCPLDNGARHTEPRHRLPLSHEQPSQSVAAASTRGRNPESREPIHARDQSSTREDASCEENEDSSSTTPRQALKSPTFYVMECAVAALAFGTILGTGYYKMYGQLTIDDDTFLAFIGSAASVSVIPFSLGSGALMDCVGVKNTLIAFLSVSSVSLSLWYFTVRASRWLYLVWTLVVKSVHGSQYILVCLMSLKVFGKRHYATNIGVVSLAALVVDLLSPVVMATIISRLGWFWLFFAGGSLSCVALIVMVVKMPLI